MDRYSVVLSGLARGPEFFRARLMKRGMKVAQIERTLEAVPCVLKHGLTLEEARAFEDVFRDAGGVVELRLQGEDVASAGLPLRAPASAPPAPGGPESVPPDPPPDPPAAWAAPPPSLEPSAPAMDLLDLESPADTAAALGRHDGSAAATPPAPAAPATVPPAAPPAATARLAATGLPLAEPKMGEFKQHDPWIFRGIGIGVLVLVSAVVGSCITRYKVAARLHDFSTLVDEQLAQDMSLRWRATGQAGEADLHAIVEQYARTTRVKVEIHGIDASFAEIQELPNGQGCMGLPSGAFEHMPHDKRIQWIQQMRSCTAPPWAIGFTATMSARVGLSKDSIEVDHWVFLDFWTPDEASP